MSRPGNSLERNGLLWHTANSSFSIDEFDVVRGDFKHRGGKRACLFGHLAGCQQDRATTDRGTA